MPPRTQPPIGKEPISWWVRQIYEIEKLQFKEGEVINMAEAARYLGVTRQRMTQICESGRIRHWKFGRSGVVTKAEVVAYAKETQPDKKPERGKEPISWWVRQIYEIVKLQVKEGEVMNMAEAAEYLEVSRQRMTQLCNSGRIRHWKFGRSGVVTKAEVMTYAKEVQSGKLVGGRGHKAKPVPYEKRPLHVSK